MVKKIKKSSNISDAIGEVTEPRQHRTPPNSNGVKMKPQADLELQSSRPLLQPVKQTDDLTQSPGSERANRLTYQQVEIAYLSNVGRVRTNNEDSSVAFLGTIPRLHNEQGMLFGLLAVADGMGGHDKGEVASNLAVRSISDGVMRSFYLPTLDGRQPGRSDETPLEVLANLIEDANYQILQAAEAESISMGTTLSCVIWVGQTAFIGHVGDSRIYIIEKSSGRLKQITRDHSMVQRLVDLGQLSIEDAANSSQRSVLYLSMGQKNGVEADVEVVSLADASHILLCSDGLWDMLDDAAIEHIVKAAANPAEACSQLVSAANQAGGLDNITVLIGNFNF